MSKKSNKKRKKSQNKASDESKLAQKVANEETVSDESSVEMAEQFVEEFDTTENAADDLRIESVAEDDFESKTDIPTLNGNDPGENSSDFVIELTFGDRLHDINVRFPWLKVVILLLVVVVSAFGMEEILRRNIQQSPVETSSEVSEQSTIEQPEVPEVTEIQDTGKEEETPIEEVEQPEQTAPEVSQAPAPQPQTSTGRKLVALTFDDGPSATQTPRLLQILAEKNVKVTFFVLGNMAQKSPEVLRNELAGGHEVASHTMTHANLIKASVDSIQWEVAATAEVFRNILGTEPKLTRPPYGNINANVRTYVNQPLILWSVDPEDWKYRNAATVRANVVGAAFDGAIILLHDIHATTVDAVASIIDDLKAAGYEFMTVSELAAARGVTMVSGTSYGSFRP